MKYLRFILLISLLAFLGCKSYRPLEVGEPSRLKLESLSENSVDLVVDLPIKNPNLYKVKVTKLEGDAFINGKKAGTIMNREKIRIPGNSNKTHQLSLKVDYSDLISGGMSVMKIIKTGEVTLSLEGSLVARSFLYRKEFSFDRKRTLDLSR
jgi:LEA14-like dessication related protein